MAQVLRCFAVPLIRNNGIHCRGLNMHDESRKYDVPATFLPYGVLGAEHRWPFRLASVVQQYRLVSRTP